MDKTTRQEEAIEKWRQAKGRGTLNLVMRFGKTRIAAKIVGKILSKDSNKKIIAIAPNSITTNNLINNLTEFSPKDSDITIMSRLSLINHINNLKDENKLPLKVNLLILDEVHKLLESETIKVIKQIEYNYILCLTGSALNKKQIETLKELNAPIIDSISEEEAVREGWIANSIEYNLGIDLDDHDKIKYAKYSDLISETLEKFYNLHKVVNRIFKNKVFETDFSLVLSAFTGIKYKEYGTNKSVFIKPTIIRNIIADIMGWKKDMPLTNSYNKKINADWNPDNIYETAKKFKDYVKQRNDILICNRPKINTVIEILKTNSVPTICFNESISMCEILADYFNVDGIPFHSSIESRYVINPETGGFYCYKNGEPKKLGKASLKKLAIEGIKNGTYKYLFTAQSLNEGLTIENIEQVITTGGSCNAATYQQRIARGKTFDYLNPNKTCIIINIYIKDFQIDEKEVKSRDKQKLIIRQALSETKPIWVDDLSEIFN